MREELWSWYASNDVKSGDGQWLVVLAWLCKAGRGCEMKKNMMAEGVGWLRDNKKKMKMKDL